MGNYLKPLQEYIAHVNASSPVPSTPSVAVADNGVNMMVQDEPEDIVALLNTKNFKTFIET